MICIDLINFDDMDILKKILHKFLGIEQNTEQKHMKNPYIEVNQYTELNIIMKLIDGYMIIL